MNAAARAAGIAFFVTFTALPARAQDIGFDRCMKAAGGVTVGMLDCIGSEFTRQDEALNALWQERLPRLEAGQREAMREAQRQWIACRDATCQAESVLWGKGTFSGVARADCRLRLTRERLEWLKRVLTPGEGADRPDRE